VIVYERPVRFDDVDAAGLVFYGRFSSYCHEALEALFEGFPGGYAALITERRVGFPVVHLEADFRSAIRYGDVIRIAVDVLAIGTRSATFGFTITRADGSAVATLKEVCAVTDLAALKAVPIPADLRDFLAGRQPTADS